MKKLIQNPYLIFVLGVLIMSAIFILLPINFFDSEIHYQTELQDFVKTEELPLGYYLGIGVDSDELLAAGVKNFKLTAKGAVLVAIMLIGIPGMVSYRFHLKKLNAKNK